MIRDPLHKYNQIKCNKKMFCLSWLFLKSDRCICLKFTSFPAKLITHPNYSPNSISNSKHRHCLKILCQLVCHIHLLLLNSCSWKDLSHLEYGWIHICLRINEISVSPKILKGNGLGIPRIVNRYTHLFFLHIFHFTWIYD